MVKSTLIYFMGMDGSGKTTQAKILKKELDHCGIKNKYTWNRFEPFLSYPCVALARMFLLKDKDAFLDYKSYTNNKNKLFKSKVLSMLYIRVMLVDYFFQISFKVTIPLLMGINVICDRYIYDTMVDLMVDSGNSLENVKKKINRFLFFIPKPNLVFFIDIPAETAFARKDDVPSIDYLVSRRNMYHTIADCMNSGRLNIGELIILDGRKTVDQLKNEIKLSLTNEVI